MGGKSQLRYADGRKQSALRLKQVTWTTSCMPIELLDIYHVNVSFLDVFHSNYIVI